jgi:hypothetical protein
MKAGTRIVLIASANGVCGAVLSIAVVLQVDPGRRRDRRGRRRHGGDMDPAAQSGCG